ncbi:MAG: Xaa-Pro peptidase family protein [Rectinemataceae bacterium]|jgi:Xaa-Pro aminopeptidase
MERMRDPERERLLRDAIKGGGLQAILAWYPEDIVMACGTWPCLGLTICLYPAEGQPVFYASSNEPDDVLPPGFLHRRFSPGVGARRELNGLLADDLRRLGIESGELGIPEDDGQHAVTSFPGETPPMTSHAIEVILGDFKTRDATAVFTSAGQRKTPLEIEALRRANAAAAAGLDAFHQALVPGVSEAEIAARVESAIQCFSGQQGCRLARGWAHVQGGANIDKGGTFSRSSALRVGNGDLALMELATCVDGYWSDLTRTAGIGELGPRQRALLACVKEAQAAAINAVRPGVSHEAVDAVARRVLIDKGYGAGIIHGFGHQVGFRYHDRGPALQPGSTAMLEEGMVITIEPGSYGSQLGGGARFEDNILVGPRNAVLLSPIENSWKA